MRVASEGTDDFFGVAEVARGDLVRDISRAQRVIVAREAVAFAHAGVIIVQTEDEEALHARSARASIGLDDVGGGFCGGGGVGRGPGDGGIGRRRVLVPDGDARLGQPQRMWADQRLHRRPHLGGDIMRLIDVGVEV